MNSFYSHDGRAFDQIPVLKRWIEMVLEEDIGRGDITTRCSVPHIIPAKASLKAKAEGVLAGLEIFKMVYDVLGADIGWQPLIEEGQDIKHGDELCSFEGSASAILTGERVALNILQRMSGIASYTRYLSGLISHTPARIVDTRKTAPGMRVLDKHSVRIGGGVNHRLGLDDAILIKDNHIELCGGVKAAVERIRKNAPLTTKIEVEANLPEQVYDALECNVDIIMLDNMSIEVMRELVKMISGCATVEASGDIGEENIVSVADTGVDYISIGALTHSVRALDISLDVAPL